MALGPRETKDSLLQAAGELFADLGYEGARTREIARRANTNMASIGYHFNGKENLYLETLRFAIGQKASWGDALEQAQGQTEHGVPIVEAMRDAIRVRFEDIFNTNRPIWHTKLIIRALLEPSPALKALVHENLVPEFTRVTAVARVWNAHLSEDQAMLWANAFFGQEVIYVLAQAVILEMKQWDNYPAPFLDDAAGHIARTMTDALRSSAADSAGERKDVQQ